MDKVIVYGLGKTYEKYRDYISKHYDVVGYSDRDERKSQKIEMWVSKDGLDKIDSDYILIASWNTRIADELVRDSGGLIKHNKVKMLLPLFKNRSILGPYYSEDMEDLIIDRLFGHLHGDYSGIHYIDLGTLGGINSNNTYFFYIRGAQGILVEADSDLIEAIKNDRPRDIVINKAIYEKDGQTVSFYKCREDRALSSLKNIHIDKWKDELDLSLEETKVETISINSVFEMLDSPCDILSVDIEGYDYKALKSLDYSRFRPKVIVVEMLDKENDLEENEQIINLLESNNYSLFCKTRPNGIFVDIDYYETIRK